MTNAWLILSGVSLVGLRSPFAAGHHKGNHIYGSCARTYNENDGISTTLLVIFMTYESAANAARHLSDERHQALVQVNLLSFMNQAEESKCRMLGLISA